MRRNEKMLDAGCWILDYLKLSPKTHTSSIQYQASDNLKLKIKNKNRICEY